MPNPSQVTAEAAPGPSEAWALAAMAISHVTGQVPLPREMITARVGNWNLTFNNTGAEVDGLASFDLQASHETVFAFAVFGPDGGMIGGASEDAFIEDMKQALPEAGWRALLGEDAA